MVYSKQNQHIWDVLKSESEIKSFQSSFIEECLLFTNIIFVYVQFKIILKNNEKTTFKIEKQLNKMEISGTTLM